MQRAQSNQQLVTKRESLKSSVSGLRKISSNLMELLKNRQVTEPSYTKKKIKAKIDVFDLPADIQRRMPTPKSTNTRIEQRFVFTQNSPQSIGKSVNKEFDDLVDTAASMVYVKKDLAHVPSLKSNLDKTAASAAGMSVGSREGHLLATSISEIRQRVESSERQKYENLFKKQLVLLLTALEISNPETFITSDTTMEFLAHEIRRRIMAEYKPPEAPSRPVKKPSASYIEDPDESQREMRRLKELVVKLQNEINENMKKSANQRIKELYEDNLNYQRKIADLIDQLRKKEQEFLIIPVGKIAQDRIDAAQGESADLRRQLDELRKKYDEDLADYDGLKKAITRVGGLFPASAEVNFDPYLLLTVVEQKQALLQFSELVVNLRSERDQFQSSLKTVEGQKADLAKRVALLESMMSSSGLDLPEPSRTLDQASRLGVKESAQGFSEERLELSSQLEHLNVLRNQLTQLKDEITKSGNMPNSSL